MEAENRRASHDNRPENFGKFLPDKKRIPKTDYILVAYYFCIQKNFYPKIDMVGKNINYFV